MWLNKETFIPNSPAPMAKDVKQHLAEELIISAKKWREKGIEIGKIRAKKEVIGRLEKLETLVVNHPSEPVPEGTRFIDKDQAIKTINDK